MFLAEYSYEEDISAQREEAFEDGKEQGIQQGIQQSLIDTAKKMLKKSFSVQEIVDITGLTVQEIQNIK